MGEENGFLYTAGRVGCAQTPRKFAQTASIRSKSAEHPRLCARTDNHHLLSRPQPVDQGEPFAPRLLEACCTALFPRLHARAQIYDHDYIAGGAAEVAQPRIGESSDE